MSAATTILFRPNMVFPQNLFRRHANRGNRDGDGSNSTSDSPLPTTTTNGGVNSATATNNMTNPNNTSEQEPQSRTTDTSFQNDEEEEQELIVQIPTNNNDNNLPNTNPTLFHLPWYTFAMNATANANSPNNNNNNNTLEPSTAAETTNHIQLRREAIRKEVERVQRANAIHFALLCLVPTSLLLIVIAAIVSEDSECSGDGLTVCEREPRSFVNAFTTRCICDAVRTVVSGGEDGDVDDDV